jgi:hypothetical protein
VIEMTDKSYQDLLAQMRTLGERVRVEICTDPDTKAANRRLRDFQRVLTRTLRDVKRHAARLYAGGR